MITALLVYLAITSGFGAFIGFQSKQEGATGPAWAVILFWAIVAPIMIPIAIALEIAGW